jgi:2-iminobutanoate/2-iminopropanoate deaminase
LKNNINLQSPISNFPKENMSKETISTPNAPAAVGPYSQAIRVGNLLYTAGQVALDPATMKMTGSNVTEQAEQVLTNLQAVLEAGGSSLNNVIKTTVFLTTMDDYGAMNAVYARYFSEGKPARSAVAVNALPLGALVEIEAVALVE